MVQSVDSVDTDTQLFLPYNERVHETNSLLLVVGMGCGIIILILEMAPTISSMGSGRSTSLCDRQFPPIFAPSGSSQNIGRSDQDLEQGVQG